MQPDPVLSCRCWCSSDLVEVGLAMSVAISIVFPSSLWAGAGSPSGPSFRGATGSPSPPPHPGARAYSSLRPRRGFNLSVWTVPGSPRGAGDGGVRGCGRRSSLLDRWDA